MSHKSRSAVALGIVASAVFFFNLSNSPLLTSAQAQEPEEFYPFTEPEQSQAPTPRGVMPDRVKPLDVKIENGSMRPPFSGDVRISYTMPKPGLVTIRVLRAFTRELYLATILNAEFRDAGRHEELWDGRDYYGKLLDGSKTPLSYSMWAESLSEGAPPGGYRYVEYEEGETQGDVLAKTGYVRHVHGWHEKKFENIPLIRISQPQEGAEVSGRFMVLSAVDRERRGFGDKYGYGVRYYIDKDLVHEEFYTPASGGYFSYELDTTAYEDGEHLLYVGMCDHNEHVTSHGIKVLFNNFGAVSASGAARTSGSP